MSEPVIKITDVKVTETIMPVKQISFEIPGGNTTPQEFATAVSKMPEVSGRNIILIEGRGPIWGYGMIMHKAHATTAIGCFDPRLEGYVVVQSHNDSIVVGQMLTLILKGE